MKVLILQPRNRPSVDWSFLGGSLPDELIFSRAGSATYFGPDKTLASASAHAPRFTHDPVSGEALGLLIEEQRTNLFLNNNVPVTQTVTVSAQAYTLSFYGSGSIALSGAHTAVIDGAGAYPTRTTYVFTPSAGSLVCSVTGSVQWVQVEAGRFATSIIITADAIVTRPQDRLYVLNPSWLNDVEGTLGIAFIPNLGSSGFPVVFNLSDGSTDESLYAYINNGTSYRLSYKLYTGGVSRLDYTTAAMSVGVAEVTNAIFRYKATQYGMTLNGVTPLVSSMGYLPVINRLDLFSISNGTLPLSGTLRRMRYWPRGLSTADLQRNT